MNPLLTVLIAALLSAPGAGAPTVDTVSDAAAFEAARVEYIALHQGVIEDFQLWLAAPSGSESLTALNALEGSITATIDRLRDIEVRDCFVTWHRAALAEFETL